MSAAAMTMPATPVALRALLAAIALLLAATAVAQATASAREPELLSAEEYPLSMEEVVVRGQRPQWREKEAAPRWDREKFELEVKAEQPRLQALPKYTRDERDDYDGVRDRMNREPRIKLFELKF